VVRLQPPLRAAARVLRGVVLLQDKVGVLVRQEPRRRGQHVLLHDLGVNGSRHSDIQYIRHKFPTPIADIHPQSKLKLPPNFLLGITASEHFVWGHGSLHHHVRTCALTSCSFVSSENRRCASHSHSSDDTSLQPSAHVLLRVKWHLWLDPRHQAWRLSALRTVLADTAGSPRLDLWRVISTVDSRLPDRMRRGTICLFRVVCLRWAPDRGGRSGSSSWRRCAGSG